MSEKYFRHNMDLAEDFMKQGDEMRARRKRSGTFVVSFGTRGDMASGEGSTLAVALQRAVDEYMWRLEQEV